MKKVSREEVIKLLNTKSNSTTYGELALLTGYHPKSLIRINRMLKEERYCLHQTDCTRLGIEIQQHFIRSHLKTYKAFYHSKNFNYHISYSFLCKILNSIQTEQELVLIRKKKKKGNCYFEVIDYQKKKRLFCLDSMKNDIKSIKKILFLLISHYGVPENISFVNFFQDVPLEIFYLLQKYQMNVVVLQSFYRNVLKHLSKDDAIIKYHRVTIAKDDFYDFLIRRTIADNVIQFNNMRYKIKSKNVLKKNTEVILYYESLVDDLFIKYKNRKYHLTPYKVIQSKKGISKYSY